MIIENYHDNRSNKLKMNFNRLKNHILILIILFTAFLNAQTSTFRSLTIDNGLSNFVVTSIYKDSTGFVWIGTDNSLDRFDGVDFKHFKFESGELNKKRVTAITESTKGNLFVANGLGLWKLNNYTQKLDPVFPDIIDCRVSSLKWDTKESKLYIGSDKGLYVLNSTDNKLTYFALNNNVISSYNQVTGIESDKKGMLWLTTRKGLCSFYPKSGKIDSYDYNQKDELSFFAKITRIGDKLYIGTSKRGIIVFDIATKKYSQFIDVGSDIITDLSGNGKDLLYVATDGNGVHFVSVKENIIVKSLRYNPKAKDGIRSNSVYSLLVDRDGIIWTGFYQAGLDYSLFQQSIFETYKCRTSFSSDGLPVRTFLITKDEKLIGTREGLYYINEKTDRISSFDKNQLRSNLILSLIHHKGEIYIGTYGGGVSVLNTRTLQIKPLSSDFTLLKGHVFHFETDRNGLLWMATSAGIYRYNKEKNELISFNNSNSQLFAGNVFYLLFDSSGKGWVATENGLCIYDPASNSIKSNIFPKNFFNNEIIKVIHEDEQGQIYFCPDKGNILVSDIDMRDFGPFELTKKFSERVFLSIIEDKKHNLWIGSDNGLILLNPKSGKYRSFSFADGIPNPLFSADAATMADDGKLWFGNAKGLLQLDPRKINEVTTSKFPVVFTGFYINGSEISGVDARNFIENQMVKLNYNENNISVQFVSLQFTHPGTIIYEYKLEGYDTDWKVLGLGQNEVVYNDLPAGKYVLKVRTEGNDIAVATQIIHISSFFNWVFWLIFIMVGSLIYLFTNRLIHAFRVLKNKMTNFSNSIEDSNQLKSEEKYRNSKISQQECLDLSQKLLVYIETEKPFTHPDLKISDLSQALHCSSHTLSFVFNQHLNKNYYDFINQYRIDEFKKRVSAPDSSRFTLSALAEQCGFSSRASFFRSFKKLTGITPNEYIKSIGKTFHLSDEE